jgi:hypothetical protein
MLASLHKQNLILLVFAILLMEVLTGVTLAFVGVGIFIATFNFKTNKLVRNAIAVLVFSSYWFKYGKIIDPEIGLNFLTSIIVLKILEKETVRDKYMIFFGLILLISAGSLFEKTLSYVFFFGISFLLLIRDFYSFLDKKWKMKDFLYALIWIAPLSALLFILTPRLLEPIPFEQNTTAPGEVGYTTDVNISQIGSLESNQTTVFNVVTSRVLTQKELYWRGNTLTYTDGWNWKETASDKEDAQETFGPNEKNNLASNDVKQSFRLSTKLDYFISLDIPKSVAFGDHYFRSGGGRKAFPQQSWGWMNRYDSISELSSKIDQEEVNSHYLNVTLPKKTKAKISSMFNGSSLKEFESSIKSYFQKQGFVYSMTPGISPNLLSFFETKKGFCSHYASATAIILRIKGIPTRLVSGFMGGSYNRFANYYLITQNDAHVWVEAFENGKWSKIDPTEWVAPERLELGGALYMESVGKDSLSGNSLFRIPRFINEFKLWFRQWDFLFYNWLENMDYHSQSSWLKRLNIKREWLFSIIPFSMVVFMLLYMFFQHLKNRRQVDSVYQEIWQLFYSKMNTKGVNLSMISLKESSVLIRNLNDQTVTNVWEKLIAFSFRDQNESITELKKMIRKI